MNNIDMFELEEFFNDDEELVTSKPLAKVTKRKWREIENYKEKHRLRRELAEYSQYGV